MRKILVILVLLICGKQLSSQCCSAGNPFFYGEVSNLSSGNMQFVAGYKFSTSNKYYKGSDPVEIDFIDKAYFNYLTLQTIYGISQRITIQADLGYFINKTEEYLKEGWQTNNGYGIGDANLTVKYLAYSNYKKKFRVVPSLGITIPIGVFDQESDNVKLPITVQPSSGSFKYQGSVYISKSSNNNKFGFVLFGMYEYAQLIDSKNFYYKYGNQLIFSFLSSYRLGKSLSLAMEVRNENRGKSKRNNDQVVESSGYKLVYLIPHISYSFANHFSLAANCDIPACRYYNGIQLSNTYSVSLRLSYSLK